MSKEKLEEIKKEAKSLAEKKSWIKKGFKELLKEINDELKETLGEAEINYWKTIVDFHHNNRNDYFHPESDGEKTVFCINEYGRLEIACYAYRGKWKYDFGFSIDKMETTNIRKALEELPPFLNDLLEYIKSRNKNVEEVKGKIENVLEKFN